MTAVATWPPQARTEVARPAPRGPVPRPRGAAPAGPAAAETVGGHRVAFAVSVVGVLAVGLALLLLLHTWAAQDGFQVAKLQAQQAGLASRVQALEETDQSYSAPNHLQAAAAKLGMRPAATPHVVRLHDGRLAAREVATPLPPPVIPTATKTKTTSRNTAKTATKAPAGASAGHSARPGTGKAAGRTGNGRRGPAGRSRHSR